MAQATVSETPPPSLPCPCQKCYHTRTIWISTAVQGYTALPARHTLGGYGVSYKEGPCKTHVPWIATVTQGQIASIEGVRYAI